MIATKNESVFCPKVVPVLTEGQNFSSISYLEPLQNIFIIIMQSLNACKWHQFASVPKFQQIRSWHL